MLRRDTIALGAAALWPARVLAQAGTVDASGATKVLRVAFPVAETGFDPARIVDLYSRTVTPHIFEALYTYDHLARPIRFRPLTAAAMPEHSDDFRTWTVRLQPGIHFADDPAFGGRRRELVAEDYVYSFKRIVDPANRSPVVAGILEQQFVGLAELRDAAVRGNRPFDYDRPIEGLRALDRYTIRFRLGKPNPRFVELLATSDLFGAVAREVVERYGDDIPAHPVGTGPFRLVQWRRSSLIVLERNPGFREMTYDAEPAPDDAEGQALLARLRGRRLPMVDRVEISIIGEDQPRWLAFLNGQIDRIDVPPEFVAQAMPGGQVAPYLAQRGVRGYRSLNADSAFMFFNMDDPVVGGYTPDKVALRRAIALGIDTDRLIRVFWRGQAVPAQSPVVPHTTGFDPAFRTENGDFDPPRAKALLDLHGYVDRDRDGWRELPDGRPLVLEVATQPDQRSRQRDELLKKDLDRLGIRVRFFAGQWPEQLRAARAGKLQVWALGSSAASPDGQGALARFYGPQVGSQNLARFRLEAFDRLYQRMDQLPDGPEREALFREAKRLAVAYMPYKFTVHRIANELVQPWLVGYRRPLFWNDWWQWVDIDPALRGAR
ncbi:MAG: bicyclomycin resistance protein [Rubrivivax sp.]|nr:bicyclomycin resistance protein [Rubrivivax sp.]